MSRTAAARPSASWFGGYEAVPVALGLSGAAVWALQDRAGRVVRYVKAEPAGAVTHRIPGFGTVLGEAERTAWLRDQGLPAAEVLDAGADGDWHVMVTTAVPGVPLSAIAPGDLAAVGLAVGALGQIASALHGLPITDCPFDRDLEVLLAGAAAAVELGTVDADDLDDTRVGRTPADLLAEAVERRPDREDLVVAHGDACLPNVLFDPDTGHVTGLVDLGRLGISDRHADLALAVRSLSDERMNPAFGPSAAREFLRQYPAAADPAMLDFYALLDEFF